MSLREMIFRLSQAFCHMGLAIAFGIASASVSATELEPAQENSPWHIWAHIDLYANSEPVSLAAAFDKWQGPLGSGNFQETDNRIEVGVASVQQRVSLFYRYAQWLDFSADTARLYHHTENDVPLMPGETFALALQAHRFVLGGLRFQQNLWTYPQGELTAAVSGFTATRLLDGQIDGSASALTADSYNFDVNVDYRYHADPLFDRPVNAPRGYGATMDINLRHRFPAGIETRLLLRDLLGYLRWQDVPATRATAASNRTTLDSNGHIVVNPLLTGIEFYLPSFRQRIPVTGEARVAAQLNPDTRVELIYSRYPASDMLSLAATRCFGRWCLGLSVFPQVDGWGMSLAHRGIAFSMQGNKPASMQGHWQRWTLSADSTATERAAPVDSPVPTPATRIPHHDDKSGDSRP